VAGSDVEEAVTIDEIRHSHISRRPVGIAERSADSESTFAIV
jgi:hypothetical protein